MSDQIKIVPKIPFTQNGIIDNNSSKMYVRITIFMILCIIVFIIIYNYFMVQTYDVKYNDKLIQECNPHIKKNYQNTDETHPDLKSFDSASVRNNSADLIKGIENTSPEKGVVKVIFYHASWCPHCVKIMKEPIVNDGDRKYSVYGYLEHKYANNPSIKIIEFQQDYDDRKDPSYDLKKTNITNEIKGYKKLRGFPTIRCISENRDEEYNGPRKKDEIEQFIMKF